MDRQFIDAAPVIAPLSVQSEDILETVGVVSISSYSWAALLEVGIAEIDEQHRSIFRLLNKLREASGQLAVSEQLSGILDELEEETRRHFDDEERLMREIGFPDTDAHVREHERLAKELESYRDRMLDGNARPDFSSFIQSWLIGHLMTLDRKYAEYLNSGDD